MSKERTSLLYQAFGFLWTIWAVTSVLAIAGSSWIPLSTASHFQHLHFLGWGILLAAFAVPTLRNWMRKPRLRGICALVGLSLHGGVLASDWTQPEQAEFVNFADLEVLWANLHGSPQALEELQEIVRQNPPQVIALGEARHVEPGDFPDHPHVLRSRRRGVMLLSRIEYSLAQALPMPANRRDLLEVEIQWEGTAMRLFAAHTFIPGSPQIEEEFDALARHLKRAQAEAGAVALVGDLNQTPWSAVFRQAVEKAGVRHACAKSGLRLSWFPIAALPVGVEIDHVLASEQVRVEEFMILPPLTGSDHRPLRSLLRVPLEAGAGAGE